MKIVEIKRCQHCGGSLLKEREDDSNNLISKCQLCGRPHTMNGELITPKVRLGRVLNSKK